MKNRQSHRERLRANLRKNYLYLGVSYINLTQGLWMIWLSLRGYSLTELGILEGIFHLTSFLMEVPTGLVADLLGRKTSRLWGRILFLLSLIILYYGRGFTVQAAGFIFCALGYNLESGAGEALIYDSLKELDREEEYKKTAGRNNFIFESGAIISFLAGGYCAHYLGYAWVFLPAFALAGCAVIASGFFEEPRLGGEERDRLRMMGGFRALKVQTAESLKVVRDKPRIAFLILFTEMIMMFITSLYFYLQTYWKGGGKNEFTIGLILACASLLSALAGLEAGKFEKRIGPDRVFLFFPVYLIICFWGIALTPWAPFFYCLTGFAQGILYVAVQDYLNRLIPSERRATILSFQSMAFSLYMIIIFPLIGITGDRWGLKASFSFLAAIATLFYLIYLLRGRISSDRGKHR